MALPVIPSITTIKNRIVSDIEGKINQTVPALPLSLIKIIAGALAGMVFLLYQSIIWSYKQIFPESADRENLILLGGIVGIDPISAVQAVILCDIPGTGVQVNAGTLFVSSNSITYQVTTTVAIVAGNAPNVPLLSLTSGAVGNLADGEILNITSPDLDLTGIATVTSTQISGADEESDDSLSARVSLRYRTRYIDGSVGGYALNGLEAPNFIVVLPYANASIPGKIDIYGKVDNSTDGVPTTAQLATLKSYLEFDPDTGKSYRRPIGDDISTIAITVKEFDVNIFINASNSEINSAISSAVNAFMDVLQPYVQGVSSSRNNVMTNTDIASVADGAAQKENAKVTQIVLTDATTLLTENNYSLYGGEFVKIRNYTFTVVA